MSATKLLLDEHPLVVLPRLACAVGLLPAIVLQQLHYWLRHGDLGCVHDGRRWVYMTLRDWCEQLPFVDERTIRRSLAALRERGLIRSAQLSDDPRDRTTYYTIVRSAVDRLAASAVDACPSGHNVQMQAGSEPACSRTPRPNVSKEQRLPTESSSKAHAALPAAAPGIQDQQQGKSPGEGASPPPQHSGRKRKRTHPETGVVFWYDDEVAEIEALVKAHGSAPVAAVAADLRGAGTDPLPSVVAAALLARARAQDAARRANNPKRHERTPEEKAEDRRKADEAMAEYRRLLEEGEGS